MLTLHEQYERLATSDEERQLAYRGLFATELDEKELGELRDTVNRGWPLGSDRFKDEIERALQCAARPPKRGRPSRKSELTLVAKRRQPVYRTESYTDHVYSLSFIGLGHRRPARPCAPREAAPSLSNRHSSQPPFCAPATSLLPPRAPSGLARRELTGSR